MRPVILFRKNYDTEEEFAVASQYFPVIEQRTDCKPGDLVIGRFSTLPFHRELEKDVQNIGGQLINDSRMHDWIANFEYYDAVREFTPETWDDSSFPRASHKGPFIVKGRTNSRKHSFDKLMFAKDKPTASIIASDLMTDPLIAPQGVIYREYIPLKRLETGINGLPFSNEWRFFYYKNQLLSYGFYWTSCSCPEKAEMTQEGLALANQVADVVKDYANFFVLDIAEKESGGWILIEINNGCQSGLSLNDPHQLYSNLMRAVSS